MKFHGKQSYVIFFFYQNILDLGIQALAVKVTETNRGKKN